MFFFPYKVDLNLRRIPFLTILICLACIVIYSYQFKVAFNIATSAVEFCEKNQNRNFKVVIKKITGSSDLMECVKILKVIHGNNKPQKMIKELAENSTEFDNLSFSAGNKLVVKVLTKYYKKFKKTVEPSITARLMYDPRTLLPLNMLTSVFAHGSWAHLLGNLFFFFAFAAAVEVVLGGVNFLFLVVSLALGTNLTYSLFMINSAVALPTLGLSGVVMGMIGMFTFLMPTAKIRCILWLIIIVKKISLPAWILACWYIGWDVYQLFSTPNQSNVNIIAHVSGAAIGVICGLVFFRNQKPASAKKLRRAN